MRIKGKEPHLIVINSVQQEQRIYRRLDASISNWGIYVLWTSTRFKGDPTAKNRKKKRAIHQLCGTNEIQWIFIFYFYVVVIILFHYIVLSASIRRSVIYKCLRINFRFLQLKFSFSVEFPCFPFKKLKWRPASSSKFRVISSSSASAMSQSSIDWGSQTAINEGIILS